MDDYSETVEPEKALALRAYGISGSTLKKEVEVITGVNPGKNAVHSPETGRVSVTSEVFGDCCSGGDGVCTCNGGGGGGEEGVAICLIIILAIAIAFVAVWIIVMLAFSIMTLGGFFRKRFRTLVTIENENKEFIGKLAVITVQNRGILDYPFEHQEYDEWMVRAFRMFNRLKNLRQISIFFGFWWGFIEVFFLLYDRILNQGPFDMWPLRYVMIAIFLPLLLYSPIMEIQFRGLFEAGDEMIMRLVNHEPSYSPTQPMMFSETPIEVGKISNGEIRKE